MNRFNVIAILLTAFFAVFAEAHFDASRRWLGAKVDLLPALVVYTALSSGVSTLALLAACGGLWFDSLSMNPLGVTVLPLFAAGILVQYCRDLILRDQAYAQFVVGFFACVGVPVMTLMILVATRQTPLFGWETAWQLLVMGAAGGALTPVCFRLFDAINRAFGHPQLVQTSFRPDRVIERGPVHDARR
ncbi:MAG TPA: rod shape-determining protein MreD [Verrucomicrobiae bacterium]|nr:rod shape-determining protein MreD [Verrucomicrobiae bacterium]